MISTIKKHGKLHYLKTDLPFFLKPRKRDKSWRRTDGSLLKRQ